MIKMFVIYLKGREWDFPCTDSGIQELNPDLPHEAMWMASPTACQVMCVSRELWAASRTGACSPTLWHEVGSQAAFHPLGQAMCLWFMICDWITEKDKETKREISPICNSLSTLFPWPELGPRWNQDQEFHLAPPHALHETEHLSLFGLLVAGLVGR